MGCPPFGGGAYEKVWPVRSKRFGSMVVEPFANGSRCRMVLKSWVVSPGPEPSGAGAAHVLANAWATPGGIVEGFFSQATYTGTTSISFAGSAGSKYHPFHCALLGPV